MSKLKPFQRTVRGNLKAFGLLFRLIWMTALEALWELLLPKRRKSVMGKVILVTGASRGLGREMALQFAKLGAKMVLLSSKQSNVDSVASEVRAMGGKALAFQCDVSDVEQVKDISKKVLSQVGPVDILINNAAVGQNSLLLDTSPEEVQQIININLMSNIWTVQQFLPAMLKKGEGQVVGINSILGFSSTGAGGAVYSCVKGGLINMTECLESEIVINHPKAKIHFTNIYPGVFLSSMITKCSNRLRLLFPIMTANDVAVAAVDAILKEKREAAIPRRTSISLWLGRILLSRNAVREAEDFMKYKVEVST